MPATDEWAAETGAPYPALLTLTLGQLAQSLDLLDEVPHLIGELPVEVRALLRGMLVERREAAATVANWLGTLDTFARAH